MICDSSGLTAQAGCGDPAYDVLVFAFVESGHGKLEQQSEEHQNNHDRNQVVLRKEIHSVHERIAGVWRRQRNGFAGTSCLVCEVDNKLFIK